MRNNSKGFTMIEMVIVLVLIALLGVALIPSMGMIYKQQVRQAADIICGDLTMMRKETDVNGKTYSLSISSLGHTYTIAPSLMTKRDGNDKDGISPNITYSIIEQYNEISSASTNVIYYNKGKLVGGAYSDEVSQLSISIGYKGNTDVGAEIVYDGFTGGYSIGIKP